VVDILSTDFDQQKTFRTSKFRKFLELSFDFFNFKIFNMQHSGVWALEQSHGRNKTFETAAKFFDEFGVFYEVPFLR
jgi:hypothetical protein